MLIEFFYFTDIFRVLNDFDMKNMFFGLASYSSKIILKGALRMKKRIASMLLAVLLIAVTAAGCSAGGGKSEIKVVTVTPLSGSQAAIGESLKNGAQMAFEERKTEFEKLGLTLKFEPKDDQADPKVGVSVAQSLISDKSVMAVVGHYNSGVAIPSSEVYKKENLVMVSPANTAVDVTERGLPSVNRIVTRDDVQGPSAAEFAVKDLGAKSIFVIHDKTTYGQGVADEFKKAAEAMGAAIPGYEGITAGESDFSAIVNKAAAAKPDVVYFGGMYPEGSLLMKQLKEKQVAAKFIGPDGMDSPEVIKIAGESAVGTYFTTVAGDVTKTAEGKAWAEKYKAKFSKDSDNWSAYGYDAMNVALDGIVKAFEANGKKSPTREQVSKAVRDTKGFQGVAAKVTFNAKGDNEDAVMYIFQFTQAKYPPDVVKEITAKDYLK